MIPLTESSEVIARLLGITSEGLSTKAKFNYWVYRKRIAWLLIRKYSGRHVPLKEISGHFHLNWSSVAYGLENSERILRKPWHEFTKLFLKTELEFLAWIEANYPDISFKRANNHYKRKKNGVTSTSNDERRKVHHDR